MADGKIAYRCRADTDVYDMASGGQQTLDKFFRILIRSDTTVPPYRDVGITLSPKIRADAFADAYHILCIHILAGDAPYVIFSEHMWV